MNRSVPTRRGNPQQPFAAVIGVDGSGKSSVLQAVRQSLVEDGHAAEVRLFHFRPDFGRRNGSTTPTTDPHARPPRGWVASILKLAYWWLDYTWSYWFVIRPGLRRRTAVLFDRYYDDVRVDPRRYRYGGPTRLLPIVGRLVPRPIVTVLLDVPAPVGVARKGEVDLDEATRQRSAYRALVAELGGVVVDADRPLDDVVPDVVAAIVGGPGADGYVGS
ncbi:MAG: hypothetical protein KDB69_03935 [Acidimicrobiia bacterium]|nr:hypothetical protein [Acidimicrobiia bacterium]